MLPQLPKGYFDAIIRAFYESARRGKTVIVGDYEIPPGDCAGIAAVLGMLPALIETANENEALVIAAGDAIWAQQQRLEELGDTWPLHDIPDAADILKKFRKPPLTNP